MTDLRPARSAAAADLRAVASSPRYRQLLAVRLTSQVGDGVVQLGLVSLVLLDPGQETSAPLVAGALSVAVLPFTVVGPFAGVLLDRWPRQRTLVLANATRALLVGAAAGVVLAGGARDGLAPWQLASLWVLVLAALSVNRFLLAGLGAALPRTVAARLLVTANAVTPTLGTGAYAIGGGLAATALLLLEGVLGSPGGELDHAHVVVIVAGAGLYLLGALLAARIPGDALGPDEPTAASTAAAARAAVAGLAEGARHVWRRAKARNALGAMGAHRFAFGLATISTFLLARGPLGDGGSGLGPLALVAGGAAAGSLLAAVVTPPATRALDRLGPAARGGLSPLDTWLVLALGGAALTAAALTPPPTVVTLTAAALVLGLAGQGIKIVVDTQVQVGVDENTRGRAFAFYDVVYNAAFLLAAAVGALAVPDDGHSALLYGGIAVAYAAAALCYVGPARRVAAAEREHTLL